MKKREVGVCIIGSGRAGMIHAKNFRINVPHAKLIAVVDTNEAIAEKTASELGIDYFYSDYHDALQNEKIDAVVIVTPTIYHRDIAVAAANAGKHILCEKPMAMNEAECNDMIQAAQKNKVKLQIGFMRRFSDSFLYAKNQIDEGLIGDVVLVRSLTRGPSIPQPWMYDLKKSNGPLAEVNSHDIDTLRWLTGSEFKSVYAIGGNYRSQQIQEEFPDFYDNVTMNVKFINGKQGMIDGALSVKYGYDSRVEVLGTDGVIFIGRVHDNAVLSANKNGLTRPFIKSWRTLFSDAYLEEDRHFIQCILEDEEPAVSGNDGKMAVAVVNAGNKSIKENQVITL